MQLVVRPLNFCAGTAGRFGRRELCTLPDQRFEAVHAEGGLKGGLDSRQDRVALATAWSAVLSITGGRRGFAKP